MSEEEDNASAGDEEIPKVVPWVPLTTVVGHPDCDDRGYAVCCCPQTSEYFGSWLTGQSSAVPMALRLNRRLKRL